MFQEGTCAGADSSESMRKTGTFASAVKKISTTFRGFLKKNCLALLHRPIRKTIDFMFNRH